MKALTDDQMRELEEEIANLIAKFTPVRSGNLRYNAFKTHYEAGDLVIKVDLSIAPYMPYTNEPWVSPKWHGRRNPNQYWFDLFFFSILSFICKRFGGTLDHVSAERLKQEEIDAYAQAFRVLPEHILINSVYLSEAPELFPPYITQNMIRRDRT